MLHNRCWGKKTGFGQIADVLTDNHLMGVSSESTPPDSFQDVISQRPMTLYYESISAYV